MNGIALINGQNHSHQQIVFPIGIIPITSLSDLSITHTKTREFSYGNQALPVGFGEGKHEPVELTFTLSKKEADALTFSAPGNNVNNLAPFDIPLTFTNPSSPRFSIIKSILIMSTSTSSDVDNTDIKVEFTAQAADMQNIY